MLPQELLTWENIGRLPERSFILLLVSFHSTYILCCNENLRTEELGSDVRYQTIKWFSTVQFLHTLIYG